MPSNKVIQKPATPKQKFDKIVFGNLENTLYHVSRCR